VEVPCALRPRSVYSVRLVMGPDTVLLLRASVVRSYVHRFENAGEGETRVRYQAALQFVNLRPADQELLRRRIAGEAPFGAAGLTATGPGPTEVEAAAERREAARVGIEGALAGQVGLHLNSRVLSLSPGGMMVRMPFSPQLGSVITCTLDVGGIPVQVRGIVRDTREEATAAESADFIVGLEFIDVPDETRALIEAYLGGIT
jgi:PilZ domain-containing protein